MFCTKCGTNVDDTAQFCAACGQVFSSQGNAGSIQSETVVTMAEGTSYAGFWARFAAVFVDNLILMAITIPLWIIVALRFSSETIALVGYLLTFVISIAYFAFMESSEKSATWGKRWLGMKVLDDKGDRISFGRALARYFAHFFSYITLYIGFIMQPFTGKKQALHDLMSGTVVVNDKKSQNSSAVVIVIAVFFIGIVVLGILAAIAIPAYQDYVIKAKVSQGVHFGRSASSVVEEYYLRTGNIPNQLEDLGFSAANGSAIAIVNPNSAVITVTFSPSGQQQLDDHSLIFVPSKNEDGTISWACSSEDIEGRYIPLGCK